MQTTLDDNHPIFEACKTGDYNTVSKFLADGVSVYAQSEHNPKIFGIVANRGHKKILELMLQHGLDINHPHNRFGASVAEFAIHKDSVEWLEYFFQKGVPLNVLDDSGHSLLELAAGGGKLESLRYLLEKGAELEQASPAGGTAFRQASCNNQIAAMDLLWERGANIEIRDYLESTPLIGCAKGGNLEAVEWLLDHGADINANDKRGKTALAWAKANEHQKVADLLQSRMNS